MPGKETHAERFERMKTLYDLSKHITTLSSGSLLLIATFVDKVFKTPSLKWVLVICLICFVVCVGTSLFGMFGFGMYSRSTYLTNQDTVDIGVRFFTISIMTFILGLFLFAVFSAYNLVR